MFVKKSTHKHLTKEKGHNLFYRQTEIGKKGKLPYD